MTTTGRASGRNSRTYIDVSSAATGSATPVNYLNGFKLSQTANWIDVTSFGDGSKTYVPGMADANGTFDGFIDLGTATFSTLCDQRARKMYHYPDATGQPTVYGICTAYFALDYDTSVDDALKVSLSWAAASSWSWPVLGI